MARLRAATYPGHHEGPKKWLDVVSGVLDTAFGYLEIASAAGTSDDNALERISDAEQLGSMAYEFLRELDGANADQIPHQIVKPFQRWVDDLGIKNTIFFRADHVANYELARFHQDVSLRNVNDPSESLEKALANVQWPFLRLTVPSQALGMLPHFAIIGHELGHALQDEVKLADGAVDFGPFDSALRSRLAAEKLDDDEETVLASTAVIASWVQEFVSDSIGLLLAGPAFFFALGGFFEISGGGYGISPTHPPSELRRRLALARLRFGSPSHSEVFRRATGLEIEEDTNSPHVTRLPGDGEELYADLRVKHGPRNAAICVAMLEVAEKLADALFAEAETVLRRIKPELIYAPEDLAFDLDQHLEPLCDLIPPIERRQGDAMEAAPLSANLNVGWAALLARLDRIAATIPQGCDPDTFKMEKLHELLLKGVELAEARMTWDEAP